MGAKSLKNFVITEAQEQEVVKLTDFILNNIPGVTDEQLKNIANIVIDWNSRKALGLNFPKNFGSKAAAQPAKAPKPVTDKPAVSVPVSSKPVPAAPVKATQPVKAPEPVATPVPEPEEFDTDVEPESVALASPPETKEKAQQIPAKIDSIKNDLQAAEVPAKVVNSPAAKAVVVPPAQPEKVAATAKAVADVAKKVGAKPVTNPVDAVADEKPAVVAAPAKVGVKTTPKIVTKIINKDIKPQEIPANVNTKEQDDLKIGKQVATELINSAAGNKVDKSGALEDIASSSDMFELKTSIAGFPEQQAKFIKAIAEISRGADLQQILADLKKDVGEKKPVNLQQSKKAKEQIIGAIEDSEDITPKLKQSIKAWLKDINFENLFNNESAIKTVVAGSPEPEFVGDLFTKYLIVKGSPAQTPSKRSVIDKKGTGEEVIVPPAPEIPANAVPEPAQEPTAAETPPVDKPVKPEITQEMRTLPDGTVVNPGDILKYTGMKGQTQHVKILGFYVDKNNIPVVKVQHPGKAPFSKNIKDLQYKLENGVGRYSKADPEVAAAALKENKEVAIRDVTFDRMRYLAGLLGD